MAISLLAFSFDVCANKNGKQSGTAKEFMPIVPVSKNSVRSLQEESMQQRHPTPPISPIAPLRVKALT